MITQSIYSYFIILFSHLFLLTNSLLTPIFFQSWVEEKRNPRLKALPASPIPPIYP